jgi:hypothetical protein
MGQIGKEFDFKSLLGKLICFVHSFFTEPVEKIGDESLSPKFLLGRRNSHDYEAAPEGPLGLRLFTCL